jgi:hypothetical protein
MRNGRTAAGRLAVAVVLAVGLAGCAAAPTEQAILLTVAPRKNATFAFGRVTTARFTLRNLTDRAIVVRQIIPLTNAAEEVIPLSGPAYGGPYHEPLDDTYRYDPMVARATSEAFHAGLLLPGQAVTVLREYRPLYRTERFAVVCVAADRKYDGTRESLSPLKVYVRRAGGGELKSIYEPFHEARWREVHDTSPPARPPGPDVPRRAVLIPRLAAEPLRQEVAVTMPLSVEAFSGEAALAAAARIGGRPPERLKLLYSEALGGYVVAEGDSWWLLTGAGQTGRGRSVPPVPPGMLKDVDRRPFVRVRVGDKQEGYGPGERPAGWTFWEAYPVEYGDGRYARGEFVRIDRANFAGFLERLRRAGGELRTRRYFFQSRYFVLRPGGRSSWRPPSPGEGERAAGRGVRPAARPLGCGLPIPLAAEKNRQEPLDKPAPEDFNSSEARDASPG